MKTLAFAMVAMVLVSTGASRSRAAIQIGDQIKIADGVGAPGGMFNIDVLTNPREPNFQTFCVELTEDVDFVHTFVVSNISMSTVQSGKALTSYTAWLYDRFRHGTLASFNPASESQVNALQLAIWTGMGYDETELATHMGPYYPVANSVLQARPWQSNYNSDIANSLWSGIGNVRIMNLKTLAGIDAQDQLVTIPEPYSIAVWSLAIMCVGAAWKFKEAAGRHCPARNA